MALILSTTVFFVASALALLATQISDSLLVASMFGIVLTGLHLTWHMGLRMHIYTGLFFVFHLIMAVLAVHVYLDRNLVVTEGEFSFSVFTAENLQIAIRAFVGIMMVILGLWTVLRGREVGGLKEASLDVIFRMVGRLDALDLSVLKGLLLGSFALALFLFLTNTTVLEVSYPFQGPYQWVPGPVRKLPTIMAAVGLLGCYAKHIQTGRHTSMLIWARANFVLTLMLMLFLVGARGFFTFLWAFAGVFELYLGRRKQGSYVWGLGFVCLAWLAFTAWPTLRWFLAIAPIDYTLAYAWKTALALGANVSHGGAASSGLWVGDYPMIGESLFQMLYVIQLIKHGISLGGATFAHLLPQALPGFLDGVLWVRPINDNWLLNDHYINMGGFLDAANAYWNGGMSVMLAYVAVISLVLIGFDRYLARRQTGIWYKLVYWLYLPIMAVQMCYGVQGFARVLELLLLMVVIDRLRMPKTYRLSAP